MNAIVAPGALVTGRVVSFDDPRGIGEIESSDGTRFAFHCTQIADGSRTISPDAQVRFAVRPWHQGRYEATGIEPV